MKRLRHYLKLAGTLLATLLLATLSAMTRGRYS